MIANLLASAVGAARRQALLTSLDMAGLVLGMTAAILIGLFLRAEIDWDGGVPGAADLYRVQLTVLTPDRAPETVTTTPVSLGPELPLEFPELTGVARYATQKLAVRTGALDENTDVTVADAGLLTLLGRPLLRGAADAALAAPDSVVLSRERAEHFFGSVDCLGREFLIGGIHLVRVTGVVETSSTSFPLALLLSSNSRWTDLARRDALPRPAPGELDTQVVTLVRLRAGTRAQALRDRLDGFVRRHFPPDPGTPDETFRIWLRPLPSLHLEAADPDTVDVSGASAAVVAMGVTLVLILVVTGANFANLMTARATTRHVEVGVRRALGARRRALLAQFLAETLAYAVAALALASGLVALLVPRFAAFLRHPVSFDPFNDARLLLAMITGTLVLALAGGLYPAWLMATLRPEAVLRAGRAGTAGAMRLRRALMVLQFATCIALLAATVIVLRQAEFAAARSWPRQPDQVLTIFLGKPAPGTGQRADPGLLDWLKVRLAEVPGVHASAGSWIVLAADAVASERINGIDTPHRGPVTANLLPVDIGYFEVYGQSLLAGRTFDLAHGDAETPILPQRGEGSTVINASAARALGFADPRAAIGHTVLLTEEDPTGKGQSREIVGVAPDVQTDSARVGVTPTIFLADPHWSNWLSVRIDPALLDVALPRIDAIWRDRVPDRAIERRFLDERVAELTLDIRRQGRLAALFCATAIVLGCIGLFGLASFLAERRTREIGVRRAFGAGRVSTLWRLMVEFSGPVLIAAALACPLTWLAIRHWLDGFADRVPLTAAPFAIAVVATLVIAALTTLGHALRIVRSPPVTALRHE